ncbi:MAG: L,D-transpeptidase family protein [Verrucomicrobiota bacterium JB023]|nr:L,D-transpeptidase family protein [Verrucomicrobiota bacterium JB023]
MKFHVTILLSALVGLTLPSCMMTSSSSQEVVEQAALPEPPKPEFVNPFPPGTYDHFRAQPDYQKTYNIYRNNDLLSTMTKDSAQLVINLTDQRAQLLSDGQVALDYPVSSGKSSHPTPPGEYKILEKIVDKRSNAYGRIVDANGNVVNSDADSRKDKVPPGGKFIGASMPYWMRMTWTGIGHHVGRVPRYPASHACIRGVKSIMPTVYSKVKIGTPVSVVR